jgi:hypothetical protein
MDSMGNVGKAAGSILILALFIFGSQNMSLFQNQNNYKQ